LKETLRQESRDEWQVLVGIIDSTVQAKIKDARIHKQCGRLKVTHADNADLKKGLCHGCS